MWYGTHNYNLKENGIHSIATEIVEHFNGKPEFKGVNSLSRKEKVAEIPFTDAGSSDTGVRSQVRSARGRTAGQHREDGRILTPPTVWPLARLANLSLRRALALVQFWP